MPKKRTPNGRAELHVSVVVCAKNIGRNAL